MGASHSIYLTKRVRRPAEVLTVSEVQQLESICLQDESLHHRVIAGHFLFCMMAAARWHDSMHVVSMEPPLLVGGGDIKAQVVPYQGTAEGVAAFYCTGTNLGC